jgi:hypothetical protein
MKIQYCLIFTFLCAINSINAKASVADSLYKNSKYFEAAIAYEYTIFSAGNVAEKNSARYNKSLCYKHLGLFKKASVEMEKINYFGVNDSLANVYHYEAALCSYLSGDFNNSLSHIKQITSTNKEYVYTAQLYLLQALCNNQILDWKTAHESAIKYCDLEIQNNNSKIKYSIDSIYNKRKLPVIKSENRLKYYSLIPGLGQAYCGYYKEGAFNFLLNAIALTAGGYEVYSHLYITGYCVAAIPINKFYFGSKKRAEFLLKKHNYQEIMGFNEKVKDILLK